MDNDINQRVRAALETVAKQRTTISYRMLAIEAQVPGPQIIHKLTLCLEDIFREDHSNGEMSLAVLAVSRGEPAVPRAGFFILLRELGLYDGPDQGPEANAKHFSLTQEVYTNLLRE